MTIERAGVLIIRGGRLALIERLQQGQRCWVKPGSGVETGANIAVLDGTCRGQNGRLPVFHFTVSCHWLCGVSHPFATTIT
jgi:hypothetical protein